MTQLDPSVNCTTAASVHLGTLANALGIINSIIDSGAADHMTGSMLFFSPYSTCSGKDKVRMADGSSSSIS